MADVNDLIVAYVTARKRAHGGKTRGLASPEQQAQWRQEAVEALDALKAEAWERGLIQGRAASIDGIDLDLLTNPYEKGSDDDR